MTDTPDFSSLQSRAAERGRTGYWNFPEVEVKWAFEAGLPDPRTFPIDDLLRISERVSAAPGRRLAQAAHTKSSHSRNAILFSAERISARALAPATDTTMGAAEVPASASGAITRAS